MGEPPPACRAGLTRISRRHRTLRDQWCDSRKAVGEQIEERLVRELRGSEDVGHPLAVGEDIDCRDGPLLGAGDQLLDTAPLEDDEAEALGDVAAQALRPRLRPSAVQLITERVRRGRSVAAGDQRRHDREPVGEQLAELAVDEVRRAEDVGEVDALMQGVEGSSKRARAILGQPRSTIDLRRTILDGGILFVSTAQGTAGRDVAALVGSSILNLVDAVIREQGDRPPERRRGALVVVDEMQSMPGVDYESMLSELGKFGASFVLATQSLDKLDDLSRTMRNTLLANVGCLAIFQVAGSDARQLVWGARPRPHLRGGHRLPPGPPLLRARHRGKRARARLLHEGAQAGGRRCQRRCSLRWGCRRWWPYRRPEWSDPPEGWLNDPGEVAHRPWRSRRLLVYRSWRFTLGSASTALSIAAPVPIAPK